MKRRKLGLVKRIVSVTLAVALVATSVSVAAPEAQAASYEATMGTSEVLSATHVKDTKVLQFYRILANMVARLGAENAANEVGDKDAETVIAEYATEYDDDQALGAYLTEYPGKINFGTMDIQYVDGIGWARSAQEIDMSNVNYATPLTKVPDSEFARCTKLQKILLPSTVTEIGSNAFEACQSLTTLAIGTPVNDVVDLTNVNIVGASAFSVCTSIKSVQFAPYNAANELKLGNSAFAGCASITEIEVPIKTAANIGANAFENCEKLSTVGLYDDLKYINNAVFQGTGKQGALSFYMIGGDDEDVNRLPKSITYIGDNAFKSATVAALDLSECTELTTLNQYAFGSAYIPELILPESLETIKSMAFNDMRIDADEALVIPEACTNIESQAFYDCLIREIHLPKSLKAIKKSTFEGSEYLDGERIVIPSGSQLEEIEEYAFNDCERLETTAFLENCTKLTTIGDEAFSHCYTVRVDSNNKELKDSYGDTSVADGLRTIVLPDSVVSIGEFAFANNYALRSADLGTGVVSIPEKAFYNEKATSKKSGAGLEKVVVSNKLESIGASAFENQSRLTTIGYTNGTTDTVEEGVVQFNEGLLSIGDAAFSGCGIESSFTLSGMITYVEKGKVYSEDATGRSEFLVYDYENCDKSSDYCRIVYVDEEDFISSSSLGHYYDSVTQSLTSEGKARYEKVCILAKKVYVDYDQLFEDLSSAADKNKTGTIELYEEMYTTVTDEYEERFYSPYSNLTTKYYCNEADYATAVSVEKENGKTAVWSKPVTSSVFTDVAMGSNVAIKSYSVKYVFGMQDVILPDTLVGDKLGEAAFKECINLDEVKLPKSLTEIKDSTFQGAGKEVSNFVSTSEEDKYHDYYGLKSINIPDGVTRIGDNAFNSCRNLTLTKKGGSSFGRSVTYIGAAAFSGCVSLDEIYFPDTLKEIGKEAFSCCAVQYKEPFEIPSEDAGGSAYKYYANVSRYGTKQEKTGLTVVDFTAALNLETIGEGAFRMTNVQNVNLVDSPLVVIPKRLFEQCTYLRTLSFQSKTESIGENVLKDAVNLTSVTLPASAQVDGEMLNGAFGQIVNSTDPTITLSYDQNEVITVPYGANLRLPINVLNKETINGNVKVSVDTGNGVFENILDNEVDGLYAEFDSKQDPYSILLYGTEYIETPVTVRVELGTKFAYANPSTSASYCGTSHTLEYQVRVRDIPTEQVTLSAANDGAVTRNPNMYVESPSKVLYIPATKDMATTGILLSAEVKPAETTEDVTWTSDNSSCITVTDVTYEEGSGLSTAYVKPQVDASGNPLLGSAQITVRSGSKADTITVYTAIPVPSSTSIVCSTSGENMDANLKQNSAATPYVLDIGTRDQIKVTMNYNNSSYTEEQLAEYGEKYIYASSDPEVIEIKPDGSITALKEGTATITVTGQASGTKATFFFAVEDGALPSPASIEITGNNVVNVGATIDLTATVLPARANQEVTWSVASGSNYISVDENGTVTGLAKGTGKVIATSVANSKVKSQQYNITVNAPITEIRPLTENVTVQVGATYRLSKTTSENASNGYYVYPTDATESITWTSSNEDIFTCTGTTASVTVTGVAPGTAVLTGMTDSGVVVQINVSVILKVSKITVDSTVNLAIGATHQLNPAKEPANATEEVVYTYSSSNTRVATVSETGLITAVGPGSASITVRTNIGKVATCRVNVTGTAAPTANPGANANRVPAKKLTVLVNKPNAKKIYMAKGQSVSLRTQLSPVNTTDKVTYKSSKPKVAAVSAYGSITAKKKGTAKITITATSGKKTTVTVVVSKKQVKAKKVKVKCAKSMKRGKTMKLKVSLISKKSTDTLSFSSSKSFVAMVDAYGNVTAKKKGKVKITVRTSSGKTATKTIKVK